MIRVGVRGVLLYIMTYFTKIIGATKCTAKKIGMKNCATDFSAHKRQQRQRQEYVLLLYYYKK